MALRITQEYVSALADGVGTLRITQEYIAVLVPRFNEWVVDAESQIDFNQEATGYAERLVTATSSVTFNVTAEFIAQAESHIDFGQIVLNFGPRSAAATSTITFGQDTGLNFSKSVEASSAVAFGQDAQLSLNAYSHIEFDHVAEEGVLYADAESTIEFDTESELDQVEHNVEAVSELVFYDTAFDPDTLELIIIETGLTSQAWADIDREVSAESGIDFAQSANGYVLQADAFEGLATSSITFGSEATISIPLEATSHIAFGQTAQADVSNAIAESSVDFDAEAEAIIERNLEAATDIEFGQAVTVSVEDDCSDKTSFCPLPAASGDTGFKLLYPATGSPTDEVLLRAPNFGNVHRITMDRINRETRGGTLIIYSDPIWAVVESFAVSCSNLSEDTAYDLLDFMRDHLGREIKIIDWEHRAWRGIIIMPNDPIVQDGRDCRYTVSFEFEGERV